MRRELSIHAIFYITMKQHYLSNIMDDTHSLNMLFPDCTEAKPQHLLFL